MLTKTGPGRYRHRANDTYTIEVQTEGTGRRIVAVIGDKKLTVPGEVDSDDYGTFGSRYDINALFTFTIDATGDAKYTVTLRDSEGTVVDTRVVRRKAGSKLPTSVLRLFDFQVTGA